MLGIDDITSGFSKPAFTEDTTFDLEPEDLKPDTAPAQENPALPAVRGDHPATKFLDFIINAAAPICAQNRITPPDKNAWESYARTHVNEAAWEYIPVETEGESPKWMIAAVALGSLCLVFAPTAVSLIEKHTEKPEEQPPTPEEPHGLMPEPKQFENMPSLPIPGGYSEMTESIV